MARSINNTTTPRSAFYRNGNMGWNEKTKKNEFYKTYDDYVQAVADNWDMNNEEKAWWYDQRLSNNNSTTQEGKAYNNYAYEQANRTLGKDKKIIQAVEKYGIDDQTISQSEVASFLKKTPSFFEKYQSKLKNNDYNTATENASVYNKKYNKMKEQANIVRAYLNRHKGDMTEEQYKDAIDYLRNVRSGNQNLKNAFNAYDKYYSQFSNADEARKADMGWGADNSPFNMTDDRVNKRRDYYHENNAKLLDLNNQITEKERQIEESKTYFATQYGFVGTGTAETAGLQAEVKKLKSERDRIKREQNMYERTQKILDDAQGIRSMNDFEKLSQIKPDAPTKDDFDAYDRELQLNEQERQRIGAEAQNPTMTVPDKLGVYLSADKKTVQSALASKANGQLGTYGLAISDGYDKHWDFLTKDDIDMYYYLLNKKGKEEAYKWLDDMQTELDRRANENTKKVFEEGSALDKLVMNALSVPANVIGGATAFASDVATYATGGNYNPYGAGHALQNYAQNVRGMQANKINNASKGIALPGVGFGLGDAYEAVMSGVDSLVGAGLFGTGYTVLMGMGASASTAKDLYQSGASKGQMAVGGLLAGAAEYAFEKISIENLLNTKSTKDVKNLVKQVLKQGGIEASEEMFTETANIISNALVMGSQSDWRSWEQNGGWKNAIKEATKQVINAGIGGAVSGGAMGAVGSTHNLIAYNDAMAWYGYQNMGNAEYVFDNAKNGRLMGLDTAKAEKAYNAILAGDNTQEHYRAVGKAVNNAEEMLREQASKKSIRASMEQMRQQNGDTTPVTDEEVNKVYRELNSNAEWSLSDTNTKIAARNYEQTADTKAVEAEVSESMRNMAEETIQRKTKSQVENAAYASVQEKVASEGHTITGVKTSKNGVMTLSTESGEEVQTGQADYSTQKQAVVYETVASMRTSANSANKIASMVASTPENNITRTMLGVKEAYTYGRIGQKFDTIKPSGFIGDISTEMARQAYNLGRADAMDKYKGTQKTAQIEHIGNVRYIGNINKKKLSKNQKAQIQVLGQIAKSVTGSDIVMYKSTVNAKGERVMDVAIPGRNVGDLAPNGVFSSSDGTIYIDVNAGNKGSGLILHTAAHELTHFASQYSDKFESLKEFVVNSFVDSGKDFDALVMRKMSQNKGLDVYDATEEVVADAMSGMLTDTDALYKIAELKQHDKSLYEKLKEVFGKLYAKVKEIYKRLSPESMEGQMMLEMKDSLEKVSQLFSETLVDAGEKYQAMQALGLQYDEETESISPDMFSLRTFNESDYVENIEQAAKEISDAIDVDVETAKKYIQDVTSIARMIADDTERLDYTDTGLSSFVSNSEYGGSFDHNTLCKKRRLLTGTFTAIQKALPNTGLTAQEILQIRKMMDDAGLEVSCGKCYVEGSRAKMGEYLPKFLDLLKKYYPDMYQPNMAEVNTPDGIEQIRIEHPDVYEKYEYFWNHHGTLKDGDKNLFSTQGKPKLYQMRTAYKSEILDKFKKGDPKIKTKNDNGGIRFQSFSDFEIVHLIDVMQAITDMSRVGLAGQAYTKVPEFALALGDTGLKINLSIDAWDVDENGKLVFNNKEGMNFETAMKLRNQYSKNVGTICCVYDDDQLLAALADDRIDFIIPFHRSQWKKAQYKSMGLPSTTKDYTYQQNEKWLNPSKHTHEYRGKQVKTKCTNYMPNQYWKFKKTGKENAEAYLEMCAKDGKRPKFYKFLDKNPDGSFSLKKDGSTDGYWKLLIDFKMYDNDGVGSPQLPVKPVFNMDECMKMLEDYKGGASTFPVAQGIVEEFVSEYKEKHKGAKFSDRATGEDVKYSIRTEAPPKKTLKGYKVFVVKDGKLYPPMVANPNASDTPVGVWLNADVGKQAPDSKTGRKQVKAGGKGTQGGSGSLAFRPGWHLGDYPRAAQFDRVNPETGKKELFPENFVWAECDIAADVDYQEEAMSYGYNKNGKFQHSLAGLPKLPVNGYYRYRTNPRPDTVPWLITGAMKVNRLLSDDEVNKILEDNGIAPVMRKGGNKTLSDLGLGSFENAKFSDRVLMGSYFSGGGTLESGLVYKMLKSEFAVEHDGKIAEVWEDNHGKEKMFVGDVRDFDKKVDNLFYFHASPSCQSSSKSNHKRGETETDITTAQATADRIRESRPPVVSIENVKEYKGTKSYKIITDTLDELGYTWDAQVYNASDYGNPTKRQRLIIRAVEKGLELPDSPEKVSEKTSWGDATRDLWGDLKEFHLNQSTIKAIRNTPGLKNLELLKQDKALLIYGTNNGGRVDYAWEDELCPTLTTKCGDARIIINGKVYQPTVEFMGRLQGLPDTFKYDKKTLSFKIIGNGIPVQLTQAVMGELIESAYSQTHEGKTMFSERDAEMQKQQKKVDKALERQNAKLKKDNEYLKELVKLQGKVTDGKMISKNSIKKVAGQIMRQAGVTGNAEEFREIIEDLYTYIRSGESEELESKAEKAVDWLVDHHKTVQNRTDDANAVLGHLIGKRFRVSEEQKKEIESQYGSYNDFRKKLFGSVNITTKDDAPMLESSWSEFAELFPYAFNEDTNELDMPLELLRVVDQMKNSYESDMEEYAFSADMTRQELLTDVYDGYWNVSTLHTVADKYQKQINELKAKHKEQMQDIREEYTKNVRELKEDYKEQKKNAREYYRQRSEKKISEVRQKQKERTDSRKTTEVRNKVKKVAEDLRSGVWRTKGVTYPEGLVRSIIDICDMIDPTGRDQETKSAKEHWTAMEALRELREEYDKMEEYGYDFSSEHDDYLSYYINQLAPAIGNKPLRDMDREQITQVYEILNDIKHCITTATQLYGHDERMNTLTAGESLMGNMDHVKKKGLTTGKFGKVIREWTLNPMRAVREMTGYDENAILYKLMSDINEGRVKQDMFVMESNKMFEALRQTDADRKTYNEAVEKPVDFGITDTKGKPVLISKMQAMQALLTYERATSNDAQKHLESPVLFIDSKLASQGKMDEAYNNGKIVRVNTEFVKKVSEKLTDWDRRYMEAAMELFNVKAKNAINETTLITKHRIVATDKNYIPYVVNKNELSRDSENLSFNASIENEGMLKRLILNADTQIIISGLNTVLDDHIKRVGKVYGLTIPVRNWNKVFNMKEQREKGQERRTVKKSISNTWGESAVRLLDKAVADMQGSAPKDTSKLVNQVKSAFVTSTLASNISVTMKQFASYPTAGAVLSPKSLRASFGYFFTSGKEQQKLWDEIDAHTPQHYTRRLGMSIQELGDLNQTNGILNKVNQKMGMLSPMQWIQAFDVRTTQALWNASKIDAGKKYAKGTDEYWEYATKLYNKTLEDTQPMYDSLHRAQVTKNQQLSAFVMFQTQPLQNSGILHEGYMARRAMIKQHGKNSPQAKEATKKFVDAAKSQLGSHLLFTGMTLLSAFLLHRMNPWRDKNKEVTWKSVSSEFLNEFAKNYANAILPFANYMFSAFERVFMGSTYDVLSDPVADKINGTFTTIDKLKKSPSIETASDLVAEVLSYLGVPAQNILKLKRGIGMHLTDIKNGTFMEAGVYRDSAEMADRIYRFKMNGDNEALEKEKANFKSETAFYNSLREGLTNNDPRINEAAEAKKAGKMSEYKKIAKSIIKEGVFTQNDVVKAINTIINKDKESEPQKESSTVKGFYTNDDAENAIENGNTKFLEEYKEDYAETQVKNGKKKGDAKKNAINSVKKIAKTSFDDGDIKKATYKKILTEYCGMSDSEAEANVEYVSYKKKNPKTKIDSKRYSTYKKYGYDEYGVTPEEYVEISSYIKNDLKGVDADGNGVADPYTKIDELIGYIDNMNISPEKKSALFRIYNQGKKNIDPDKYKSRYTW